MSSSNSTEQLAAPPGGRCEKLDADVGLCAQVMREAGERIRSALPIVAARDGCRALQRRRAAVTAAAAAPRPR